MAGGDGRGRTTSIAGVILLTEVRMENILTCVYNDVLFGPNPQVKGYNLDFYVLV